MGRLGALRDRQFRRLFAGQALSSFGDTALYLTLGIWAKTLTGSNTAAGGVFLALGVPSLFAPLAGHLADRIRRKTLLIAVDVVTAMIVLSLVFVRSRDEAWLIYVVAFCYGTSAAWLARPAPACARTYCAARTWPPPTPCCRWPARACGSCRR